MPDTAAICKATFANISNIASRDSGGGTMIDLVELNDGRVLRITEDAMVLYKGMDDFYQRVDGDRPTIFP